jgi:transcriptional regulator with XRE-family HTH domain
MKISRENTDTAVLTEVGKRLTRVRLNHNLTQEELAKTAGVSKRTIERLETGRSVQLSNLVRAFRALHLTDNLDQMVPQVTESPMAKLKLQKSERQRASSHKPSPRSSGTWAWADKK